MGKAAELAPSTLVEVGDIGWQRMFHGPFDAGIAEFLRVEIGGIGGQVGHREVAWVGGQEGRRSAGAVRMSRSQTTRRGLPIWRRKCRRAAMTDWLEMLLRKCRA